MRQGDLQLFRSRIFILLMTAPQNGPFEAADTPSQRHSSNSRLKRGAEWLGPSEDAPV